MDSEHIIDLINLIIVLPILSSSDVVFDRFISDLTLCDLISLPVLDFSKLTYAMETIQSISNSLPFPSIFDRPADWKSRGGEVFERSDQLFDTVDRCRKSEGYTVWIEDISREAARRLFPDQDMSGWCFEPELIVIRQKKKIQLQERAIDCDEKLPQVGIWAVLLTAVDLLQIAIFHRIGVW
jgi:hypothetical protein